MTRNDTKEACRLLLVAGVPKNQITPEALLVANALIKDMNQRLAKRLAERLFPEWRWRTQPPRSR